MSTHSPAAAKPSRPDSGRHEGHARRAGHLLRWTPVGMAAVVAVDSVLDERAEYFDAASLLRAWADVFRGDGRGHHVFLLGQERLGDGPSLLLGTTLLAVEAALLVAAVTTGWSVAARVRARRRRALTRPEPEMHTTTGEDR